MRARRGNGRRPAVCGLTAILGFVSAWPTLAQVSATSSAGNEEASGAALQEVVVTAERREGTVQSTPLSISAYTGAELEQEGISNISELGSETPGISEKNSGPGQTEYEMRGVSSEALSG
jgi:iron complex outermembrane receptor protein